MSSLEDLNMEENDKNKNKCHLVMSSSVRSSRGPLDCPSFCPPEGLDIQLLSQDL